MALLGLRLAAAALVVGAAGFNCPPVNYNENVAMVPIAGGKVFFPVYRHLPETMGGKPTIVVIALHGAGRNGDNYFGWVTNAMHKQEMGHRVAVYVPVFADKDCSAAEWMGDPDAQGRAVKWSHSTRQWVFGATSDGFDEWNGISSFEAIDDLIEFVETAHKSTVKKIVVTGFSAGAQMGLRWSIMSSQGVKGKTLGGTPMRIILGSPSSVTYLNDRRPSKNCSLIEDQGPVHNCTQFLVPGHGEDSAKTCKDHYNRYGFGLGGLEKGAAPEGTIRGDVSDYVHKYIQDDTLMEQTLAQHWATKDVTFQFGTTDTKDCINGACADDCGAMDQGTSRLQRGLNYMAHLRDAFPGYQPKYSTFEGGHRPELFFAGNYFNKVVFEKEGWEECLWDSFTCFSLLWKGILASFFFLSGVTVGSVCFCCRKSATSETKAEKGVELQTFLTKGKEAGAEADEAGFLQGINCCSKK